MLPLNQNPLVKPLLEFNDKISKTFDKLPSTKPVDEVIKRIALVSIAIVAYAFLSILALAGVILSPCFRISSINPSNLPETPKPIENPPKPIKEPQKEKVSLTPKQLQFKTNAQASLNRHQVERRVLNTTLTLEQQKTLKEINEDKYTRTPPPGIKIMRGGKNFVFFLESVPDFVFKPMDNKKLAEDYIEVSKNAEEIVLKNNLHLLHVPQTSMIELDGQYYVMQERGDFQGRYNDQKGVYSFCWQDPDLKDYTKTVFSQLLQFITKTGFLDVKYDNIPLSNEGRVVLIDLDQSDCFKGLTTSCDIIKNAGLFNYLPLSYIDEFLSLAKLNLDPKNFESLKKEVEPIKLRKQDKTKKAEAYSLFHKEKSISKVNDLMNPILPRLFADERKQKFSQYIMDFVNNKLLTVDNFSLQNGRKISIPINVRDNSFKRAVELWGKSFQYMSNREISFKSVLKEILDALKEANCIYKYRLDFGYNFLKIAV